MHAKCHPLVKKAFSFAKKAHKGQTYGNVAYNCHLFDVYEILYERGIKDVNILSSAWLHDVIEDTRVTYSEIKRVFNEEIAEIVYSVTDELGRNRKERHEKTYPKLQKNEKGIILKQADRYANIKRAYEDNSTLLKMYKKEHKEFEEKLRPYGGLPELWDELNRIFNQ